MQEINNPKNLDLDTYIESIHTNGISIPVYFTNDTYYTVLAGKYYTLCSSEANYRHYVETLVNKYFNLAHEFNEQDYLCYFDNAGNRDLQLVSNGRLLKVYLVNNADYNLNAVIKDARRALNTFHKVSAK